MYLVSRSFVANHGVSKLDPDNMYRTRQPICCAIYIGNIKMVELLHDLGFSINKITRDGSTPLHCAVEKGSLKMVKILFKLGNTVVDVQDMDGDTPYQYAIKYKNYDVANYLAHRMHPKMFMIPDRIGNLPIHQACENYEIIISMFRQGCPTT